MNRARSVLAVLLLSLAWFLVLPIMTSPCIPYFSKNTVICENRWAWLGGYHAINQKLHYLFGVSFDKWHDYIYYHYWHLGLFIITSLLAGLATYLLIRYLKWPPK